MGEEGGLTRTVDDGASFKAKSIITYGRTAMRDDAPLATVLPLAWLYRV